MEDFFNRTVFVTGGARGIGRGMAQAFARAGARVAVADINFEDAQATSQQITEGGTEAIALRLDVTDREAFAHAVDEAEASLGPIDVICNNAGIITAVPISELSFKDWDRVLQINLGGVINGVQTVLPRMLARRPGYIVNTASGAGLVASANLTYSTSKFAVVGLSESLRQQDALVEAGIGVSVLCPGPVRTDVMKGYPKQTNV